MGNRVRLRGSAAFHLSLAWPSLNIDDMTEIEVLLNRRFLSQEEGVSEETRRVLASENFTDIMTFDRETVIIEEGKPHDYLYFTLDGMFHASSTDNPSATHRLLGKIQPAEFIGEMSIIEQSHHASATVKALENSRVLRMHRDHFASFRKDHPQEALEFLIAVAKQLCKRLRQANAKML